MKYRFFWEMLQVGGLENNREEIGGDWKIERIEIRRLKVIKPDSYRRED
jgi:hypothetical protein